MDWISTDERLPDQGIDVDIWAFERRITRAFWDRPYTGASDWYWAFEDGSDPYFTGGFIGGISEIDPKNVTHWMPLPPAPEEVK